MPAFSDARWSGLHGGYGVAYDPRPALTRLELDPADEGAWQELWNELHHQGDIGVASYAAVPTIVALASRAEAAWNAFALAATIEMERHRRTNPPVPSWLSEEYLQAWSALVDTALVCLRATRDPLIAHSALSVVALGRGLTKLGALLTWHDEATINEAVDHNLDWAALCGSRSPTLPAS